MFNIPIYIDLTRTKVGISLNLISLKIALRYAQARNGSRFLNFITVFSIGGITLGVIALIVVMSVMNGFEGQLKQRILGAVPHVVVNARQSDAQWQQTAALFKKIDTVVAATPVNLSTAMLQGPNKLSAVSLQGINPLLSVAVNPIADAMRYGDLSSLTPGSYHIIMGTALADQLGLQLGDKVRVLSAQRSIYTPLGRVPNQRKFILTGVFDMQSQADTSVALVNISDAARLLRYAKDSVGGLRLYLNDAFAADFVATESAVIATNNRLDSEVVTWRQQFGELFAAVKMEKNMMWLMLGLIIAVAAFNIISALVILVTEKQTDIAILSTLGLTRSKIALVFIAQGTLNGLIGTVIGLLVGLVVTYNLNDILFKFGLGGLANPVDPSAGLPISIVPQQILTLAILTVFITVLATLYPSFRAGQTNPAEALKHE